MNTDWIKIRQDQIYGFIKGKNMTTVDEISMALKISSSTVRRDIKRLEKENKVLSFHGGVYANEDYEAFMVRKTKQAEEKRRIGQTAAGIVEPGDTIYMGGGSTVYQVALALSRRIDIVNITIVTSAMNIAVCFENNENVKVIMPGGIFKSANESMTSKMTIDALKVFNFTKIIAGARGITAKQGWTLPRFDLCEMKKSLFRQTKQVVIVCDHSKFGTIAPFSACPINDIDMLVTDEKAREYEDFELICSSGPKVIVA